MRIPRTYYEEQLYNSDIDTKMKDMFFKDSPAFGRDYVEPPQRKSNI